MPEARARTGGRRGGGRGAMRLLAAAVAAVTMVGAGVGGVAQAAPARSGTAPSGPRAAIAARAGGLRGGRAADTSGKPAECFYTFPDCASSDPEVAFEITSVGDTTSCEFQDTVEWGDKTVVTRQFPGGQNGAVLWTFRHSYDRPGGYTITVTGSTVSGGCGPASGTLTFAFVTAGIYADFTASGQAQAKTAVADGWGLIANVAGLACARRAKGRCAAAACASDSFVHPTGSDGLVERALAARDDSFYPAWISYWTPAVPAYGTSLEQDGMLAGEAAAAEIKQAASAEATPVLPTYVGLDIEESPAQLSCGTDVTDPQHAKRRDGDKQCWLWAPPAGYRGKQNCFVIAAVGWKEFAAGWAAGVRNGTSLAPALYMSKSAYQTRDVGSFGLPVIIALTPVLGSKPLTGPNIIGYAAYGTKAHPAPCDQAAADIDRVRTWGGLSTIQFSKVSSKGTFTQSIYCPPGKGSSSSG
jgi:hypothetical protein